MVFAGPEYISRIKNKIQKKRILETLNWSRYQRQDKIVAKLLHLAAVLIEMISELLLIL